MYNMAGNQLQIRVCLPSLMYPNMDRTVDDDMVEAGLASTMINLVNEIKWPFRSSRFGI